MAEAACEQLIYTWHAAPLHGSAGHGVVLRTPGWPGKLGLPGGDAAFLTGGASTDATTQYFSLQVAGGTLFGARTRLGIDGSGRPGNFLCHLMFDPAGRVGCLDVLALASGGWFASGLADATTATSEWASVSVPLAETWTETLRPDPPLPAPELVRACERAGLAERYAALVAAAPAGLANGLCFVSDADTAGFGGALPLPEAERAAEWLGEAGALSAEAARLDGPRRWSTWWRRTTWGADEWATRLRFAVLCLKHPSDLSVGELVEVGERRPQASDAYARELVTRLSGATASDLRLEPEFADRVIDAALRAGTTDVAVALTDDTKLFELAGNGALGKLSQAPEAAVDRLLTGTALPPAAVLRGLIDHPRFWPALRQSSPERRDEFAAWLLRRGGVRVPDWFVPAVARRASGEYERFLGKLSAPDAYDRLFGIVGDQAAVDVLTTSGNLDAWALALAKRGRRAASDPRPVVATFNTLAEGNRGIGMLRLTTTQRLLRLRILVISLLVALVAAVGVATWALWFR